MSTNEKAERLACECEALRELTDAELEAVAAGKGMPGGAGGGSTGPRWGYAGWSYRPQGGWAHRGWGFW